MAHPQNSPRGLFTKTSLKVPTGGSISFDSTSRTITANSTGIKIGSRYISTNTTGNATT
jgi:hypothetical protein